ncbi:MAG: tyrosine-type recombinase/integrase [Candidatus Marinimicrobia bacterium]|nr:tyrosine-type recombinase/integrase [Candidatus Neomarinimicrobiota bacterium]
MWKHSNGYYYYSKKSLGTRDKTEAKYRESELKRFTWAKRLGLVEQPKSTSKTFQELAKEYYRYKSQTRANPKGIYFLFQASKKLNPLPVIRITRSNIDLAFKGKSEGAKASYFQELRVFFNWLIEKGYIRINPVPKLKVGNRDSTLTEKDFKALKSKITDLKFLSLVEFAYESGCRQSECLNPIVWENDRIIVCGKTGERAIPYQNPLHDLSRFKGMQWEYNRSTVTHYFKRYLRVAGLSEKYCFETLRHTFGTRLVDQVGIYKTALFMGHRNIKTTQKYTHLKLF